MPTTSQDTKILSGRRAVSVQSVDSGFIATQEGTSLSYSQNSQSANLQPQYSPYHHLTQWGP